VSTIHETRRPNGPELTGADPHAGKYSAREAATRGSASGAAWSWAAFQAGDFGGTPDLRMCFRAGTKNVGAAGTRP
jgi:hypothetical protein